MKLLATILATYRRKRVQRQAQERLARLTAETKASFEAEQYRRRRAAALKHTRQVAQ